MPPPSLELKSVTAFRVMAMAIPPAISKTMAATHTQRLECFWAWGRAGASSGSALSEVAELAERAEIPPFSGIGGLSRCDLLAFGRGPGPANQGATWSIPPEFLKAIAPRVVNHQLLPVYNRFG